MACYGCGGQGSRTIVKQVPCTASGCVGGVVQQWQQPNNTNVNHWQAPGRVNCNQCGGRGRIDQRSYGTCPDCNGDGGVGHQGRGQSDTSGGYHHDTYTPPSGPSGGTAIDASAFGEFLGQLIVLGGLAYGAWWGYGQLKPWASQLNASSLLLVYGGAAALWLLIATPLAVLAAVLRRVGGASFTVTNAVAWTAVAGLATMVALMGAGWMMWEEISVIVTLGAATTCALATAAVVLPRISSSGWRLGFTGLLLLGVIGALITWSSPSQMNECLSTSDVRLWMTLQPLTQAPKETLPAGTCSGVLWVVASASTPELNTPRKGSVRQPSTSMEQTVLRNLLKQSTGSLAYERSMAAWLSVASLAIAISAALLTLLARFVELATHRWRVVWMSDEETSPGWLVWGALLLACLGLMVSALWAGSTQAKPISLSLATVRPLVLLAMENPTQLAWSKLGPFTGQPAPAALLASMRQRADGLRTQMRK